MVMMNDNSALNRDKFIPPKFFERDATKVAQQLIGASLAVNGIGGIIVETEAYRMDDAASHSFRGPTVRNAAMFGRAGCAYVYRSHGLHWCFNIVCLPGSAVLIRALEPKMGEEKMQHRRSLTNPRLLCAGPGRLCQALAINYSHNGLSLENEPFELSLNPASETLVGPRIGIARAVDLPWRFGMAGSLFLSRPFK